MVPTLRACFALLWVAAGLCCKCAGAGPTLASRLLAEDPSAFDGVLDKPNWHARSEEVGDELDDVTHEDFENVPACDWCLEELQVSKSECSCREGALPPRRT